MEQDQINSSIQGILQILNRSLDVIVEFLTSTELCYAGVKAGSCCLHGDSVMVPELYRDGDGVIQIEKCVAF